MVADALEAVLFGMAVDGVRPLASSFHDKTTEIAARTGGRLAFDVRIYGDRKYQRIAAIGYPGDEAGILALNHDGQAIEACFLDAGFAGFIEPLERWSSLPLRDQARNSVQGFADLLVAALRKAARLDIAGGTGKVRADHSLSGKLVRPRGIEPLSPP